MRGPPAPSPRYATLGEALQAAAASDTGLTFVDAREEETFLPYATLWFRASGVAAALAELGIGPGDRVALVLPTSPTFMDAFFGVVLAGAVPVPLYPPVRLGRMEEFHARTARMIGAVGARLVLTDRRIRRLLGQAVERSRPDLGCRTVEELESRGDNHVERQPGDLALIQFSSGTTVDPKPVALTHRNLLANVEAIDRFLPEDGATRQAGVSWLPLYHDMGLIGCLLLGVAHPGPLTLIPPELFLARPALWLRAISRRRATVSPAPNFAYGLCLKRIRDEELDGVDLSSWRLALNGAEPISAGVLRRFSERFSRWGFDPRALTPVYGLSEASLAVTFSTPSRPFTAAGRHVSVGTPLPGMEVEVRGEAGLPCEEGVEGRIFVKGPSVMEGYFGAAPLADGWLDTGDLGFVLGGELHVSGRAKDLVILRGANHAPQEFEEALEGVEGVRSGCAVAVGFLPDGADGEELAILAELAQGAAADEALIERIRAAVVQATGIRPHTVRLLAQGTLPRTSSGKLRRGEARRQLLEDDLQPPAPANLLRIAGEVAKSSLAFAKLRLGG